MDRQKIHGWGVKSSEGVGGWREDPWVGVKSSRGVGGWREDPWVGVWVDREKIHGWG